MPSSENNLHPSSKYSATQRIFLVTADLAYFQDNNIHTLPILDSLHLYAATYDLTFPLQDRPHIVVRVFVLRIDLDRAFVVIESLECVE